ncbi:AAA family ATPase [Nocardia thailandica]|uniref:AAA family ATPase n=1 Tax=Nocardia thailandica TaxID=257275 RepID=UPI0002D90969|nr:AAA family ATPase [Nocardia thailandica]
MRLSRVRIRDYRPVNDSGEFEVEPGKTLLVGINEAGKTALLKALQQINAPEDADEFEPLRDYPRARYIEIQRGERKPSEILVAEATFTLTDEEKNLVLEEAPGATDVTEYTRLRYLDNRWGWSLGSAKRFSRFGEIQADLKRLRAYLVTREESDSEVAALDDLMKGCTVTTAISGQLAVDFDAWLETAFLLIEEGNAKEEERHARLSEAVGYYDAVLRAARVLHKRVPLFVYYSTYFTVRPRINLAQLAARQAADDTDPEYDFGNLCLLQLLGLTAQQLSALASGEPNPATYDRGRDSEAYQQAFRDYQHKLDQRHAVLNSASVDLTKSIREVWGDDKVELRIVADGQYLKVNVVDDLGVEVELDQRSEGFRWLVSFFVVFKAQARGELKNAILLLDEPGLSLHALKQQEFRSTVTRLAQDNQVIYTTHSPFMVGTDELDLVRIVEMTDRSTGTKVHTRLVVDDPRSVYPLQAALGYELAQSLFGQPRNLVCEGMTDMMYVEALNTALDGAGLKNAVAVVPAASASKVLYYVTLLHSQKLKVAALLDSDQAGDRAAQQDELVHLLTNKQILRTKDYCAGTIARAEIEDLLRETLVQVAKHNLGWDVTATAGSQAGRPIIDIFTKEISGFSKYKLARAFVRWLSSHDVTDLTADERTGVTALFKAINNAVR